MFPGAMRRAGTVVGLIVATSIVAALLVAVAPGSTAGAPRQPSPETPPGQQQQPVFRAGVRIVRVDVSVTGRDDRPIEGLQAADFEVTEDDVPQKIETVQFIRLDGRPAPDDDMSLAIRSPEHAEAEAAREDVRLFAFFLDDYHIDRGPAVMLPLRRALTSFIEQLEPMDLAVIMDPLTPLGALEFTRSKPDLTSAIKSFEGRHGQFFPVRSAAEEAQLRTGNPGRLRAQVTLSALTALVTRLGGLREGRKNVLFVSQGPSLSFADGDLRLDIQQAVEAANRGNVTIHTFDPRGLGLGPRFGADSLSQLAADTGGRRISDTNAPEERLRQVVNDASAYYLLGYSPTRDEDDGKFHTITVRVKRPGVRVLARKGYWAPDRAEMDRAAAAAATADPGVAEALGLLEQTTERRGVETWMGFSRGPLGRTTLTITWAPLERPGLPAVRSVEVEVFPAGSRTPIGPPIALAASAPGRGEGPHASVTLDPGPVSVRFTARAAGGEIASRWDQSLAVPGFGSSPIDLATPRFHRARSVVELRGLLQAASAPVPSTARRFRRTDRVFVDIECYAAGAGDPPQVSAALVGTDGRELRELERPEIESGRVRLELPVAGLAPGTYLLRLRASRGDSQVEHLTAFRVVSQ